MAHTVGTSSFIGLKNRVHLKYTEAAINEILRLSSTQPLLSRATVSNPADNDQITVADYILPSNMPVMVNAYAIHRDSAYWPDAERFDPSRWIDERGELCSTLDSFIPFGVGARSCIGDALSHLIMFLIIANLVQRFEIETVVRDPKATSKMGVMRRPADYDIKFTVRK